MDDQIAKSIAQDLRVISRTLAYLCLATPGMNGAGVGEQAQLLKRLGLDNQEIARLFGTTPKTISVRAAEVKKNRGKKKAAVASKSE
jgi:hypothetical protein